MDTIFRTLLQITITTKVLGLNFEDFLKNLPAEIKKSITDMRKNPEHSVLSETNDIALMDFKTKIGKQEPTAMNGVARKLNEMLKPTDTVDTKLVTEVYKPAPRLTLLGSSVTLSPRPLCVLKKKPTVKPPTIPPPTIPPPIQQIPIPIPIQIPIYAQMPIVLPMRSYYEPVKHDHPPLHKIIKMIEKDEKKWKEENGSDKEDSMEIAYSDMSSEESIETDSETDSDDSKYNDVGHEYYDDVIKINAGHGRNK